MGNAAGAACTKAVHIVPAILTTMRRCDRMSVNMGSRVLFTMAFLGLSVCFAQEAGAVKPECNAQTKGNLWPEKIFRGSNKPVEICVARYWKYRWEQLTVDISQLRAKRQTVVKPVSDEKPAHTPAASE